MVKFKQDYGGSAERREGGKAPLAVAARYKGAYEWRGRWSCFNLRESKSVLKKLILTHLFQRAPVFIYKTPMIVASFGSREAVGLLRMVLAYIPSACFQYPWFRTSHWYTALACGVALKRA